MLMRSLGTALLTLALPMMACTERVILKETSEFVQERDANLAPHYYPVLDASDGSRKFGENCNLIDSRKEFRRNYAEIMILLDRSLAMHQTLGASTKLATVQETLRTAISTYQSSIRFGFIEYPGPSGQTDCDERSCCANKVQVKPSLNSLRDMEGWMRCETSSYPCPMQTIDTPLHLGLASIINDINFGNSFDYSRSSGNASDNSQFVFLFAAADAACAGKSKVCDDTITVVHLLASIDIRIITFTIGWTPPANSCIAKVIQTTPSSNSFKRYVPIAKESDLNTPLETILTTLSKESCELTLNDSVNRPDQLSVTFDDSPIIRDSLNGWLLINNQRFPSIRFNGQACDTLRSKSAVNIKIIDKCNTCSGNESCRSGN